MPYKPWMVIGADIFSIKTNTLLFSVDYYSMFPVVTKTAGPLADDLIIETKIVLCRIWTSSKGNSVRCRLKLYVR